MTSEVQEEATSFSCPRCGFLLHDELEQEYHDEYDCERLSR